jgi:hypothetical protein
MRTGVQNIISLLVFIVQTAVGFWRASSDEDGLTTQEGLALGLGATAGLLPAYNNALQIPAELADGLTDEEIEDAVEAVRNVLPPELQIAAEDITADALKFALQGVSFGFKLNNSIKALKAPAVEDPEA